MADFLSDLLQNSGFMTGMGVLADQENPYRGVLSGMQYASRNQQDEEKRKREQMLRRGISEKLLGDYGKSSPASLLENEPASATVQNAPAAPESATPQQIAEATQPPAAPPVPPQAAAAPPQPGGAATPADLPPVPNAAPGGDSAIPGADVWTAPAKQNVAEILKAAGIGSSEQDQQAKQMFGLLAQYGDPMEAAKGWFDYKQNRNDTVLDAMRVANAGNSTQARTQGFNPVPDSQGRIWFPYRRQDGTTGLTPALDPDTGKHLLVDPRRKEIELGGGGVALTPTRGPDAGKLDTIVSARTAAANKVEAGAVAYEGNKREDLEMVEQMLNSPGGALWTVNKLIGHESRELMTGGSAPAGWAASFWPGSPEADFAGLREKLKDQAFMDSILGMRERGGTVGQITEREGMKLEQSRLALLSANTEERFLEELQNFKASLENFQRALRNAAGVDPDKPYGEFGMDLRPETAAAEAAKGDVPLSAEDQALMDSLLK